MQDPKPIIRLEKVSKSFGTLQVLKEVSLTVYTGQTTVVIGPSGCGKSVLLKHMIALIRPDSGKIFFDNIEITALSERKLMALRKRMGFLFQGSALFDSMTVRQNICFPLEEHNVGTSEQRLHRCREVLGLVGLEGLMDRYPEQLSGGQKKRVALARALALGPEVIFYDEPTTGLDPIRADLINEMILHLNARLHTTSVVVTHDMASARKIADRILMLHEGNFLIDTTPDRLDQAGDPVVRRFVLGQASDEELREFRSSSGQE